MSLLKSDWLPLRALAPGANKLFTHSPFAVPTRRANHPPGNSKTAKSKPV